MEQHRNRKLRLLSFLLVCALMLPAEALIVSARQPEKQTTSATLVQTQARAKVMTNKEEAAEPAVATASEPATGYISRETPAPEAVANTGLTYVEVRDLRNQVLQVAQNQLGIPYCYGGTTRSGFDCSGFVQYVYRQLGYYLTRTASSQLRRDGGWVSPDSMQAGDLVFFRDPESTDAASHVGIYVGNRMMIHASSSKGISYASIDNSYFASRFIGARRIIDVNTSEIHAADFSAPALGLR